MLCFRNFPVAESLCLRREYHDFYRKLFCLTVSINFGEEPLCAGIQKSSGSENVFGKEGRGEYQDFPSNFLFCLTVPKIFVGKSFFAVFQIISGSEYVCR